MRSMTVLAGAVLGAILGFYGVGSWVAMSQQAPSNELRVELPEVGTPYPVGTSLPVHVFPAKTKGTPEKVRIRFAGKRYVEASKVDAHFVQVLGIPHSSDGQALIEILISYPNGERDYFTHSIRTNPSIQRI